MKRPKANKPKAPTSFLADDDLYLFAEGTHVHIQDVLGAHLVEHDGSPGARFAVWAPAAATVSVVGDFNSWDASADPLTRRDETGVWERFVPGARAGQRYKLHITSPLDEKPRLKADPFARRAELPPSTASMLWRSSHPWSDDDWMKQRRERNAIDAPWSIYEAHLGSWRRDDDGGHLGFRDIAPLLADHLLDLGFTHVELMPLMEHPYEPSWGYQITGYFAPASRHGGGDDLKFLIDHLHQRGLGVILDWVPSHFPADPHGLGEFDGTSLYEHADPRKGFHPDWKSLIFNYQRGQVRSFLISNALYWLREYHADALRVDAVASMLYLDYSREEGEWEPNEHGGNENLDAIAFLRQLNEAVYEHVPDVQMIAEESTSWPMVSKPTWLGGLGFGLKWDMGWMNDTLEYMDKDPLFRTNHHQKLTFRSMYATSENFLLPLSHDEVVHGKGSLLAKMPGDEWQKHANLRLLLATQYAQPGQKLLFMGTELGVWREWTHERELEWEVLDHELHRGIYDLVCDLNRLYTSEPALHADDHRPEGFEWVEANDVEQSVTAYLRGHDHRLLVVLNYTPVVRESYRLGVAHPGAWREVLNSDAEAYGGSGVGNLGEVTATEPGSHLRPYTLELRLPPLGAVFLRWDGDGGDSDSDD